MARRNDEFDIYADSPYIPTPDSRTLNVVKNIQQDKFRKVTPDPVLDVSCLLRQVSTLESAVRAMTPAAKTFYGSFEFLPSTKDNGLVINDTVLDDIIVTNNAVLHLNWSPKDTSVGRAYDGWWIGVRYNAPASLKTEEDLADATFTRSGATKNFWQCKDSKATDTAHYMNAWLLIDESYIAKAKETGEPIRYEYIFDWTKESRQKITLLIDPDKVVLNPKPEA